MRTIRFVPDAWEAYLYWQDQDKKTLKRLNLLITATARDPFAQSRFAANYPATGQDKFVLRNFCIKSKRVGWARFCAHADAKPRGQTINLSAHPTLFSENKFTLGYWSRRIDEANRLVYRATDSDLVIIACRFHYDGWVLK